MRDIDWIEIDAISLDPKGGAVAVDDVVVRFTNGRTHYCPVRELLGRVAGRYRS